MKKKTSTTTAKRKYVICNNRKMIFPKVNVTLHLIIINCTIVEWSSQLDVVSNNMIESLLFFPHPIQMQSNRKILLL